MAAEDYMISPDERDELTAEWLEKFPPGDVRVEEHGDVREIHVKGHDRPISISRLSIRVPKSFEEV